MRSWLRVGKPFLRGQCDALLVEQLKPDHLSISEGTSRRRCWLSFLFVEKLGDGGRATLQGGAIFLLEGVHLLTLDVDSANGRRALAETLEAGRLRASEVPPTPDTAANPGLIHISHLAPDPTESFC